MFESDYDGIPKGGAIEQHCNRYREAAKMVGLESVVPESTWKDIS